MNIVPPDIPAQPEPLEDLVHALHADETIAGRSVTLGDAAGIRLKGADMQESRFIKTVFTQARIEKLHVRDCLFDGCDLTACSFPDSGWHATAITNARCSGIQLQMNVIKNVRFQGCKLNLANLRFAKLENVIFEDCVIADMDLYNAQLKNVVFDRCPIENVTFSGANLKNVDISDSPIISIKGLRGLKGAVISPEQLMQLAPYFAQEIGVIVKD